MTAKTVTCCCNEVLRLRPGVYRAVDRSGREYLLQRSASQQLGRLTELQRSVLRQLAEAECSTESLRAAARSRRGDSGVGELQALLGRRRTGGWRDLTASPAPPPPHT